MIISHIDHLVITVYNVAEIIAFYTRVLGMEAMSFAGGRQALMFGAQKINLHKVGEEIRPHAQNTVPGSADLCFITVTPMQQVISHLASCNVTILEGPVNRSGATEPLLSVYINDPDDNLIEISNLVNE